MSMENKEWIERNIFALFEEKYSYLIIKRCEKHGFDISTRKINDIIIMKRKRRQSLILIRKTKLTQRRYVKSYLTFQKKI